MKRLLLVALLAVGCSTSTMPPAPGDGALGFGNTIRYYHDTEHRVSCWVAIESIACLPDSQVTQP